MADPVLFNMLFHQPEMYALTDAVHFGSAPSVTLLKKKRSKNIKLLESFKKVMAP